MSYKSEIFEILRRGQFIASNNPDERIKKLYKILEDEYYFEELKDFFIEVNYQLERGNEYFYFARNEKKVDLERKIEKAFHWIDIVDFFKTFNSAFGAGFRFSPSEIANQLNTNADLKNKLVSLKKISADKKNYLERVVKVTEALVKDGFVVLENDITDTYKVLTSFNYLEELIDTINISEEVENEIPK